MTTQLSPHSDDGYTALGRAALKQAAGSAGFHGMRYLGIRDLLVGAIQVANGAAAGAILQAEIYPAQIIKAVAIRRRVLAHGEVDTYFGYVRDAMSDLKDTEIGPEHLLLASVRFSEQHNIASMLFDFKINLRATMALVKRARAADAGGEPPPVSMRLESALRRAVMEAHSFNLASPDDRCLMIALLKESEGIAAKALTHAKANRAQLTDDITADISHRYSFVRSLTGRFGGADKLQLERLHAPNSDAKPLMDLAHKAAAADGRRVVMTIDLLHALLRGGPNTAGVLAARGVTERRIAAAIDALKAGG